MTTNHSNRPAPTSVTPSRARPAWPREPTPGDGARRRRRRGRRTWHHERDGEQLDLRGPPGAAPGRRAVHRARGRHRGRVPPAAPRARRAGRALDRRAPPTTPRTPCASSPPSPRRPAPTCSTASSSAARARPGHVPRLRQGRGAARPRRRADGRRHRDLRRRAVAVPAPRPGGRRQGQGHRPHRADPRHLRPAREVARRARRRSSWPSTSTSCRACAAGASRCPARPVAGSPAVPASGRAVPVRRRSSSTAAASAPRWPSCAARSRA